MSYVLPENLPDPSFSPRRKRGAMKKETRERDRAIHRTFEISIFFRVQTEYWKLSADYC